MAFCIICCQDSALTQHTMCIILHTASRTRSVLTDKLHHTVQVCCRNHSLKMIMFACCLVCWAIWTHRNIFSAASPSEQLTMDTKMIFPVGNHVSSVHVVNYSFVHVYQAAEQKSLDQVAGFQKSLEAFSEGILLVDTSTPDWNVLFQNEAWLRITGMSRDEVFGSKMWNLFTPAGQTKVSSTSA